MIITRITTISLCAAVVLTFILVFAVAESVAETYTYDAVGRLSRVAYSDGTSIEYTYDDNGNRLTLTANAPIGGGDDDDDDDDDGGGGGCFITSMK